MTEHEAIDWADESGRRDVGDAVVARRKELHISQAALARKAGVDPKTLQSVEHGRRWPYGVTRAAIEAALGWGPGTIDRIAMGHNAGTLESRTTALRCAVDTGAPASAVLDIADRFERWLRTGEA